MVTTLRKTSSEYPDGTALIGELSVRGPEFAAMWADHRVKAAGEAIYEMRHPLVGAMTVNQQVLTTEQNQRVVVATTEIGSPSHAAMTTLIHEAVTQRAIARPCSPTSSTA